MILNTKHFGSIEINEKGIIIFEQGLPGFQDAKQFVVLYGQSDDSPFCWLQSVDDPALAFAMVDPNAIVPDYNVNIDDDIAQQLDIEDPKDVIYYAIVVVPEDISQMTANLKAPIVINLRSRKGMQVIMDSSAYDIRYPVFQKKGA